MPQSTQAAVAETGWLGNRTYLTVLEAVKSKVMAPADSVLADGRLLTVASRGDRTGSSLEPLS